MFCHPVILVGTSGEGLDMGSYNYIKGCTWVREFRYMVPNNNLPMGVMVNRTMITPKKSKQVPIILMNTNSYNIWIRQPLLAANVVEADHCPWDHTTIMTQDGEKNQNFLPLNPNSWSAKENPFLDHSATGFEFVRSTSNSIWRKWTKNS